MQQKIRAPLKSSVRNRLSAALIATFSSLVFALSLYQYHQHSKDLHVSVENQAVHISVLLSSGLADAVHFRKYFDIWSLINTVHMEDVRPAHPDDNFSINEIVVFDNEGYVLGHSDPSSHPVAAPYAGKLELPDLKDVAEAGYPQLRWQDSTQQALYLFMPIRYEGGVVGGLSMGLDLTQMQHQKHKLLLTVLVFLVLAMLVSIIFALLVSRWFTQPLQILMQHVDRIGKGDLRVHELEVRKDEYRELADAIESADKRIYTMNAALRQEMMAREKVASDLQEREQVLTNMLENIPHVIFIKHADDLSYFTINKACEQLLGVTKEEIAGKSDYDLFPKEEADFFTSVDRKVLAADSVIDISEEPVHAKDGELRIMHTKKIPILDEQGLPQYMLGIAEDITDKKEAEHQLRLAASVFENCSEGILITDKANKIISVNNAFTELTGYSADEVIGSDPKILASGMHDKYYYANMWESLKSTGRWQGEILEKRKDGSIYPKWMTINIIKDDADQITNYIAIFSDITERKKSEDKIRHLAHHDGLTGLPNRLLLEDRINRAIISAHRANNIFAILFLDLDRFKVINDTLGHSIGDHMLKIVSERIRDVLREEDTIARLGGDEFVVLLREIEHEEDAARVAEKICAALNKSFKSDGHDLSTTASIGISLFPQDGINVDMLLRSADSAMYHAKSCGRNNYQFFTSDMHVRAMEKLEMERQLKQALARNEFALFYQPQFDYASGKVIGFEALLRWLQPQGVIIGPNEFIEVAEESGLIISIGEWVIKEACKQSKEWQAQYGSDLRVSINISARQFANKQLLEVMRDAINEPGVDPATVELELTESTLLQYLDEAQEQMHHLREQGLQIAIDDFGTGYSSLSYLKRLSVDRLKIDRSFIKDVDKDPDDSAIVKAIINMAKSLDIEVVAEGVETVEVAEYLYEQGCTLLQGDLIGKPKPAQECSLVVPSIRNTTAMPRKT